LNPVVAQKFRELIGGADASVLIVPTAFDDERQQQEMQSGLFDLAAKMHMGLRKLRSLQHSRPASRADSKEFAARIRSARAGFGSGEGGPGRIAEAYLGTQTQSELESFYKNGGVIGGTSAGAMILSSFLVRGGVDNEDFSRLISRKNRDGLGLLPKRGD